MNVSIDMPIDMLRMVFRDYLADNADRLAQELLNDLFVQCVAENHASEEDNDGAEIIIRIRVPGTTECDRLIETKEIFGLEYPR